MDIQYLYQIIKKEIIPDSTDAIHLKDMVKTFPYFQAGKFAYLKAIYTYENEIFEEELHRLAITIADRKALFYYILSEEYDHFFQNTGKKEISEDKTSLLLDAFFEAKGNDNITTDLEYSISHSSLATTDYFTYIQVTSEDETIIPPVEEEPTDLKHQNIIDTFISRSESEGGIRIQINNEGAMLSQEPIVEKGENEDELDEDVFFTETLAKIYIKQKKYEKAYKIIKHLSLNYPKKNIYFADQLSFLEKLIINSKFKDIK